MKPCITIRMGASKFEAIVRTPETVQVFDLHRAQARDQHKFRRALVKAWRDAGQARE